MSSSLWTFPLHVVSWQHDTVPSQDSNWSRFFFFCLAKKHLGVTRFVRTPSLSLSSWDTCNTIPFSTNWMATQKPCVCVWVHTGVGQVHKSNLQGLGWKLWRLCFSPRGLFPPFCHSFYCKEKMMKKKAAFINPTLGKFAALFSGTYWAFLLHSKVNTLRRNSLKVIRRDFLEGAL